MSSFLVSWLQTCSLLLVRDVLRSVMNQSPAVASSPCSLVAFLFFFAAAFFDFKVLVEFSRTSRKTSLLLLLMLRVQGNLFWSR